MAIHPGLHLDRGLAEALFKRGNEAEVLDDMLFQDGPQRQLLAVGGADQRFAKDLLSKEDAPGVMQHQAVPRVGQVGLRVIHPFVERQVVIGFAAKVACRGFGVVVGVGHGLSVLSWWRGKRRDIVILVHLGHIEHDVGLHIQWSAVFPGDLMALRRVPAADFASDVIDGAA